MKLKNPLSPKTKSGIPIRSRATVREWRVKGLIVRPSVSPAWYVASVFMSFSICPDVWQPRPFSKECPGPWCVATGDGLFRRRPVHRRRLIAADHPLDTELVSEHAQARAPGHLSEWQSNLGAHSEGGEDALGFSRRIAVDGDGEV